MSQNKGLPPVLTRVAMEDRKAWPHLRVLYVMMDNHAYWKENKLNPFTQEELAKECLIERQQVSKSLKYLRENGMLIKLDKDEYINPLYCYKCNPETLKNITEKVIKGAQIKGTLRRTERSRKPIKELMALLEGGADEV